MEKIKREASPFGRQKRAMRHPWMWMLLFLQAGVLGHSHAPTSEQEDVFSATAKLQGLLQGEQRSIQLLEEYVESAQLRLNAIKEHLQHSKDIVGLRSMMEDSAYVANPIHAYLLVKRLTVDWQKIEESVRADVNHTYMFNEQLHRLREIEAFPTEDDLHGAAIALVRLQDTYNLNVSAMVAGELKAVDQSSAVKAFHSIHTLSARDCLFLGKHSFNKGYYDKAVLWFETALNKATNEEYATTHKEEIEPFLQTAIRVHDEVLERQGPQGTDWQTNPTPIQPQLDGKPQDSTSTLSTSATTTGEFVPRLFQSQSEAEELAHYTRLCRGEKLRSTELDAPLRCRLVTRGHAGLLLQPIELEEMSLDPYIIIIHHLIPNFMTRRMITVAEPKLQTSKHRNPSGGYQKSWKRTSQNAWILDDEDGVVEYFNHRIELSTGLHVRKPQAAEEYQVANYGIGGLYVPHTDYLFGAPDAVMAPWDMFVGDRIGTLMVYLSDVEAGGATVFPRVGVTLWPEKGAAAFWWNLRKDGSGDELTRHGACPVLHGSKWVANKWIRYHEQMFNIPTPLDLTEKLRGVLM